MKQLITTWTAQKVEPGDIVEGFPYDDTNRRLVVQVESETESGSLITHVPIRLSKNSLIRRIQEKAIKKIFK